GPDQDRLAVPLGSRREVQPPAAHRRTTRRTRRLSGSRGAAQLNTVRVLVVVGAIVLIALQVRLWCSDVGILARRDLQARVDEQARRTQQLRERNRLLAVEVDALKSGSAGIEARARSELGMIKDGETFYLVVDP